MDRNCFTLLLCSLAFIGCEAIQETILFTSDSYSLSFQLWKYDMSSEKVSQITDMHPQNFNAQFSPDGKHLGFVSERDGNYDIYSMDGTTFQNATRRTFNSPSAQHHVAFAPNGNEFACVSSHEWTTRSAAGIYVYTSSTSQPRRVSPMTETDISPVWSPDGKYIYACRSEIRTTQVNNYNWVDFRGGYWHQTIVRMTPTGDKREGIVQGGGWPAFGADPELLFFHMYDAKLAYWGIYVLDLSAPRWNPKRLSPPGLHALTPSVQKIVPKGSKPIITMAVYNPHNKNRQIAMMYSDGTGFSILTDSNCHNGDYNPTLSPDGSVIVFNRGGYPASVNSKPTNIREVSSPLSNIKLYMVNGHFPHTSRDNNKIAVTYGCASDFCDVHTMNLDGSNRTRVVHQLGAWMVSWNSEGKFAYTTGGGFKSAFDPRAQIVSVYPSGKDAVNLTSFEESKAGNGHGVYSPDSSKIVYRSGDGASIKVAGPLGAIIGNRSLWVMNADGSQKTQLTVPSLNSLDNLPNWSPDGKKITFVSNRGHAEKIGIWVMNSDGTDMKEIYYDDWGNSAHPYFSLDGEWITFACPGTNNEMFDIMTWPWHFTSTDELFLMRKNGTDLTRLTHDFVSNTHPHFTNARMPEPLSEEGWNERVGCGVDTTDPVIRFLSDPPSNSGTEGLIGGCPYYARHN